MANLNRFRAQYLMEREGIEALLILSPEGFLHATGADAGVGTMWRQAGAVAVLIPADPTIPEAAIVSDLFV
ncbi:MAG TPA: aminopeptidase P family protein, partial [Rhodobacter sp.]|nr:aminopeptidase P family protein [Rhodobacter sp.]